LPHGWATLSVLVDAAHCEEVVNLLLFATFLLNDVFTMLAFTNAADDFAVTACLEKLSPLFIPLFAGLC
jgi:hypothetical protein